jgi:heterodisulfide reductase subunit D
MQFGETVLPTYERVNGEMPFDLTPFMPFLHANLDRVRPFLKNRVEMTVALHRHPGIAGVMEAAEELLRAVPGIKIVKLDVPAVGLQSVNLAALPKFKAELQLKELEAARLAGVDALVAVYHSDHRELCAHERDWPFKIVNVLEIVGESMGLRQDDHYKNLKIKQDVDAIIADSADLMKRHGVDLDTARKVIVNGMLSDQPLPLQGKQDAVQVSR